MARSWSDTVNDTPATGASGIAEAGAQLLQRLTAILTSDARPDLAVRVALEALVDELGATTAAVFFVDEEAGVARLAHSINYPPAIAQELRAVPLDRPALSSLALRTGEVQVIEEHDAAADEISYSVSLGDRMGVRAAAAVPLIAGGHRLGVLVSSRSSGHRFSAAELGLLREVGARLAAALDRERLETQLARRAEEAELLHGIALAAAGEEDIGRILAATLERLAGVVRFTGGSLAVIEGDDLVIRAAQGPFAEQAFGQRLARGHGRSWQVIDSGVPFLSNDLQRTGHRPTTGTDELAMRSWLAVPLAWRGTPFGLLEIDSTEADAFRERDITLLQAVASILSGPIELARRYLAEVELRRELARANGRLQAILAHAPMGIFFFDIAGQLAYANRASHQLLRLLPAELLGDGRGWHELVQELIDRRWADTPERLRALLAETRALRDGILVHDFPLRDPEQVLLRVAAPVFEGSTFSGHIVLLLDVTAEREARARAERALAQRDRFISIASHELKTPLTSIKGAAQLLLRRRASGPLDPARVWRQLETIDLQSDRLRALIDDLLDVSRMQSGRIELRRERADLRQLLASAVETLPDEQRARVQLAGGEPLPAELDPLRIDQVIANLLDNALKYSPPDQPVEVTLTRNGRRAVLRVADHGIGIPADEQRDLFAPFARASNAAASDDSGLGLGLFITRQIIELHGGTISVESAVSEGTTMTVRLPV